MRLSCKIYLSLSLLLILALPISSLAQDNTAPELPADSSDINVRTVDTETLKNITDEQVFEYNEELAQNPESLMSRVYQWIIQVIRYIMDNRWASALLRFIFFGIFALVLIALINQILGGNMTTAFSKKKAKESVSLNIQQSELKTTNYNELLNSALSENRFRDAVRILYLKALQELNETELIVWKQDKTNHDYLRELGTHPVKSPFNRLTYYYEYVEYGDFRIDKKGFENIRDIYRQFQEQAAQS
ncbi:MAG: DUF4129 domain-containing protein [Gracilimonas sp.]|uniref:DUF4129 domain-containing protein n=1 Tax=Gracilimonas sp. TaxID=1974203 RepID=UPI0019C77B25|nr:DUF4129 domain-containing protein [Gracilimonas sp.]MBD3616334.1 DUF4129 domain-containing protein [Gracilimonas sp.]